MTYPLDDMGPGDLFNGTLEYCNDGFEMIKMGGRLCNADENYKLLIVNY
jgi:hypothetical protein